MEQEIIIIGGGAAGFFTAINAAERNPEAKITILERGKEVLTKVRISGGGRCNVAHAEFLPKELTKNYPRGEKELRGPFHTFMPGDTISWFEARGVELKIEEDGRMFPVSDSSESIIDCFLSEANRLGIKILKNQAVQKIDFESGKWNITTKQSNFLAEKLIVASGSNPKIWKLLEQLGHKIVPPVPSLFTFNCKDERINDIPGISSPASVKVLTTKLEAEGPLLITHWGFSGPAILKLSAWGAKELNELNYNFKISVNWLPEIGSEEILEQLKSIKLSHAKQQVVKRAQFDLPKRLWRNLVQAASITENSIWADLNKNQLQNLALQLTQGDFQIK
ncbi:MAG TPA: aminoacetone oxidase family FAD-binding enzyme, partial [Salinimicrobium sp.]|nr:aminoacetone oxidase family FAD-binding enzyme [Salinimicrobium sp.]